MRASRRFLILCAWPAIFACQEREVRQAVLPSGGGPGAGGGDPGASGDGPGASSGGPMALPPIPESEPPVPVGSDITTVSVINLDGASKQKTKFTFAIPFAPGDVPISNTLAFVPSLPIQVDAKATHPDGSLRHATISGEIDLAANETKTFALAAADGTPSDQTLSIADLLATGYDAVVSLDVGGTVYTLSARALLEVGDPPGGDSVWLRGPLVSEWIVGGDFATAPGSKHPTLSGYFHVRAYSGGSQIRTDVVIENGWFKEAANGDVSYVATITLPGAPSYTRSFDGTAPDQPPHYMGARWHQVFWSGSDPGLYVRLDKDYLQKIKVVPRYANVEASLDGLRQTSEPLDGGDFGFDMASSGDNDWIAPLPKWDATFAVSTDYRAFRYMVANNDAASIFACNGRYISSALCVHMRDRDTGLPVSIDRRPSASAGDNGVDDIPDAVTENPYLKDSAHQPLIGYLPYLVTGDYYHLEEMVFWNAYNLSENSPSDRGGEAGLWSRESLRGMAWSYRSLGYAAYVLPDAHPFKAYFETKLLNNLARDAEHVQTSANIFGTWYMAEGNEQYRTFYDEFFTWALGNLVDLGFVEALPILAYKSGYPLGRMGGTSASPNGYCFQAAPAYTHEMGPTPTAWYTSWAEVFAHNVPAECVSLSCGSTAMATCLGAAADPNAIQNGQDAAVSYYTQMRIALAMAVQHGFGTLDNHWARYNAATALPNFSSDPRFAILPRNAP